jgi:hypothetical protein
MFEAGGDSNKRKPGALFESVVLSAAAIAFGCVAFADFLNHSFKPSEQMSVAANKTGPDSMSHGQRGVDYTATGTIIPLRQAPGVNPCTKN